MKIVTGLARGMKLTAPTGVQTRPTSGKVREAIMSVLAAEIEGAAFWDLFAGTGAMGIEAMSRGACSCLFVEHDRRALAALKANLQEFDRRVSAQGFERVAWAIAAKPVKKALEDPRFGSPDIIWADPPYALVAEWLEAAASQLWSQSKDQAMLMVESDMGFEELPSLASVGWQHEKSRRYGETYVHFWHKNKGVAS